MAPRSNWVLGACDPSSRALFAAAVGRAWEQEGKREAVGIKGAFALLLGRRLDRRGVYAELRHRGYRASDAWRWAGAA